MGKTYSAKRLPLCRSRRSTKKAWIKRLVTSVMSYVEGIVSMS